MARYVAKSPGAEPRQADVAVIERAAGVAILDRAAGALLIDAPEAVVRQLQEQLPDWTIAPETTFPPPEVH